LRSDAELVDAVLEGDRLAYADLVRRYERPVRAVAFRVLGDLDTAKDVAQDAFVIAYEKLPWLRNGRAFGAWTLRIARREAIRVSRQRSKTVSLEDLTETETEAPSSLDETRGALLDAVTRLPKHERVVVLLKHFDDHSVEEIAAITGRPVGTVTKQMSRAYARLRKMLEDL
jgi:RNA polymerase sigma-70 factor (ECF subfamily)